MSYMSDFGEQVVRRVLSEEVATVRYHPLSKHNNSVSYDFFIPEWDVLGEVKTKFNALKTGFSIPKTTLKKYKKYGDIFGFEYVFYFVDINSRTIYSVDWDDFKSNGIGVRNDAQRSVKFFPDSEHIIGEISPQDYKDFTLNYTKPIVKANEW